MRQDFLKTMNSTRFAVRFFAPLSALALTAVLAQAATVTGTVTNKTTASPPRAIPLCWSMYRPAW